MRTQTTDDSDTLKFRAPTLEEAVALAERSLGSRVRVLSANRIRRGGVGGFFASDLGVEVMVTPESETIEDALERLIHSSASDERAQWEANRDEARARLGSGQGDLPAEGWARSETDAPETAQTSGAMDGAFTAGIGAATSSRRSAGAAPLRSTPSSWWSPPEDNNLLGDLERLDVFSGERESLEARRQQITDELRRSVQPATFQRIDRATGQSVSEADLGGTTSSTEPAAEPAAVTDSDADYDYDYDYGSDAVTAGAAAAAPTAIDSSSTAIAPAPQSPGLVRVEQIIEELQALTASPRLVTSMRERRESVGNTGATPAVALHLADLATEVAERTEPVEAVAPVRGTSSLPVLPVATALDAAIDAALDAALDAAIETSIADAPKRLIAAVQPVTSAAPTQRQVELAVAATDQLIESLKRDEGVKRLSVRIVLRTADNQEVEAEAEWEAMA